MYSELSAVTIQNVIDLVKHVLFLNRKRRSVDFYGKLLRNEYNGLLSYAVEYEWGL